ncbi:MAG: ABC transporter ATP-binding protein [Polyangiaceae bacterium]
MDAPLLSIRDLSVSLAAEDHRVNALHAISLEIARGSVTAIVGESGSGKSLTAFSILGLLPAGGRIESGVVMFDGRDLTRLDDPSLSRVRGGEIGMVFQEPMTSLNPVYTVGAQIVEAIRLHHDLSRSAAKRRAIEWLERVGMPAAARRFDSYPHELSGGMRQRALIAMALAPGPKLLILDEPTTALDRSLEAQIFDVLVELRATSELTVLLVSHDLAVVSEVADRLVVMYAGEVVEDGTLAEVLGTPSHPYTQALLAAIPPPPASPGARPPRKLGDAPRPLPVIEGGVPALDEMPPGCRFEPRCPKRFDACAKQKIPLFRVGHGRALPPRGPSPAVVGQARARARRRARRSRSQGTTMVSAAPSS